MTALTITFSQARDANACTESYRTIAEHVGGVKKHGHDTPVPVETVLDVLGLDDALWALDAIGADRVLRLWACDCAERVLPIFERGSDDRRPREAIRVARLCARGLATDTQRAAASDAAWDAASDAARAAARAAAWGAAWDAAWAAASDAARAAAWAAASVAAWAAARDAAWGAARDAARAAAWAAAWGAAWDAAWGAAGDAARDAARDAEKRWQTDRLCDYLRGEA